MLAKYSVEQEMFACLVTSPLIHRKLSECRVSLDLVRQRLRQRNVAVKDPYIPRCCERSPQVSRLESCRLRQRRSYLELLSVSAQLDFDKGR